MLFRNLVGQEFLFYGICENLIKLDDTVWQIREDIDGYYSVLECVVHQGVFLRDPIALVRLDLTLPEGYQLVDVEYDHTWLSFGIGDGPSWAFYFTSYPRKGSPRDPKPKTVKRREYVRDPFDHLWTPRES